MIVKGRIARLEQVWPKRKSLDQLLAEAEHLAQSTGMTLEAAFEQQVVFWSDDDLENLIARAEGRALSTSRSEDEDHR
jgi:hypothetical protein